MSTTNSIPTHALKIGDTLLVNSSMVGLEKIEPDEFDDDRYWLTLACYSGNFDQFDEPWRVTADAEWQVLDAIR
jgi:hypothetical protein